MSTLVSVLFCLTAAGVAVPDDNQFGLRLKELREAAGLTQPQLAEKAGQSKAGIANLEQGRYDPSWSTVQALAGALGVDCRAFQRPPAGTAPRGRGRPAKDDEPSSRKRKRRRS
jgi:transcriptional regulator with XRE-family HTH domain